MSVQSEINRIASNVTESFTAIREAGVSVSGTATSDDMAAAIRKIPDAVRAEINAVLDEINGVII